jgi:hypothetical protein
LQIQWLFAPGEIDVSADLYAYFRQNLTAEARIQLDELGQGGPPESHRAD